MGSLLQSLMSFSSSCHQFCNSIFDCSDDSTAIKFMRMAPDVFPQFIDINNCNHRNHSNHSQSTITTINSNSINSHNHSIKNTNSSSNIRSVPHETDTDTTQSISNE